MISRGRACTPKTTPIKRRSGGFPLQTGITARWPQFGLVPRDDFTRRYHLFPGGDIPFRFSSARMRIIHERNIWIVVNATWSGGMIRVR